MDCFWGVKDETVVRVPGKCCPQCSLRSCSAAGRVYEVSFDVPHVGVLTSILTHQPSALLTTISPPPTSDSLPGLVTQFINGFFLPFMGSLCEKIKLEGIRNTKECAGRWYLVHEPWWTYCSHILKGKRTVIGYCQFTLMLEALGMSACFGWLLCTDIQRQCPPALQWGWEHGSGRCDREKGKKLGVVDPENLKVLLGQSS